MKKITTDYYYETYHGHHIQYLKIIYDYFSKHKNIVWFAGDSSLDNKYWIDTASPALNGYENIFFIPIMKNDLCYHVNKYLLNTNFVAINTAIEATTLADRENKLLDQDIFIRDDILIVSIGGNDIALKPSFSTILHMTCLIYLNNVDTIKSGPDNIWGFGYFINMFKDQIKQYIEQLIVKTKPNKIIVCTIYFPDETTNGSWADKLFNFIGYNKDPVQLQEIIKQIHIHAISKIKIQGIEIVPFPMFKILNGKNTKNYVQRVEPSNLGGKKLAKKLTKHIIK